MTLSEVAPGIWMRPYAPCFSGLGRSHAYVLGQRSRLLVEPSVGMVPEQEQWIAWAKSLEKGSRLAAVVLTHWHFDHTHLVEGIADALDVPIWGPPKNEHPTHDHQNMPRLDRELGEGDTLDVDGQRWAVWETPGHDDRHVCLVHGRTILLGDAVKVGIGNPDDFFRSLERIADLDAEIGLTAHERPFRAHSLSKMIRWRLAGALMP